MQTSVDTSPVAGLPGQPANMQTAADAQVFTKTSEDTTSIPFGVMVFQGSDDKANGALLPAANTDIAAGISVFAHSFARAVPGAVGGQMDADGLLAGTAFGAAQEGQWFVIVDESVDVNDAVRVRCDTNGGKVPGQFCKTSSGGHTLNISAFARWVGPSVDGVGILDIDMTNVALADAD